jgi:hypothetical protein
MEWTPMEHGDAFALDQAQGPLPRVTYRRTWLTFDIRRRHFRHFGANSFFGDE